MFKTIVKRNSAQVPFDSKKINHALVKAGKASGEFGEDVAQKLTFRVLNIAQQMFGERVPTVEEIQDIVEEVLLTSPYRKTAKGYIIYRDQHAQIREITSRSNVDLVDQYLSKSDWQVNENSNMAFSLQGLNQYLSSELSKVYWLNKIYPPRVKVAHHNGDFHIHDLGLISVYCVGWDLYDLLSNGFKGAPGKMESASAKHFRSALGQIVNFFYTLQGEAAGAQAFSNFDTLLAPFIHYDNLSYKEVKQALQEFVFNINVPTRVGFQTPFTNITMDLHCPKHFAEQGVVIGGEIKEKTYREFQTEMDMLNRAFLEVMMEGDAKGRVFTFPIPTYNITKDFDWDNPNMNTLWEVTARYGIPYFSNFVNSDMDPEDARSMCCRLRLDNRELRSRGGGLFGASPLTGSIGVVTINMPRLAYLSGKDEATFFKLIEEKMELAKESLEIKRKILEQFTDGNLYPYMKFYLRNIKKRTNEYWKNHFSTIGLIGMNEACVNMMDKGIATPEGKAFSEKVLIFMRDKMMKIQDETDSIYNLEATPAEGVCYRLAQMDKDNFADMPCFKNNYSDNPFYTNSTHLPVDHSDDIFEVLDHQDSLQTKYTGGTVLHGFVGEKINDPSALRELIKTICYKYRLPYFTVTPTFSVCPTCGYIAGEHKFCNKCESHCEVYSRVVGYLRPVDQWNKGKQEEFSRRKTYVLNKVAAPDAQSVKTGEQSEASTTKI
ncbi:MAG: ribonucleoside triphosphate reductase [Candidatus Omnitrophica bacterium]|nr:ribonucleoside triphosphate reductase [Candidatus Omnitrophota bacterium]